MHTIASLEWESVAPAETISVPYDDPVQFTDVALAELTASPYWAAHPTPTHDKVRVKATISPAIPSGMTGDIHLAWYDPINTVANVPSTPPSGTTANTPRDNHATLTPLSPLFSGTLTYAEQAEEQTAYYKINTPRFGDNFIVAAHPHQEFEKGYYFGEDCHGGEELKFQDYPAACDVHHPKKPNFSAALEEFALADDFSGHQTPVLHILPAVDADVDSDNNNALQPPDRSAHEDQIEDAPLLPGKFIAVNISDEDQDGIPGFADGFSLNGVLGDEDDQDHAAQRFTPLVLEIPADIDLDAAILRITYEASDPAGVNVNNGSYTPATGHLRIWTKDGNIARSKAPVNAVNSPGDYVAPGEYTPAQLGLNDQNLVVTLYIEGIRPSTALGADRILVELDPDGTSTGPTGFDVVDAVRVTVVNVDLDIDSDNNKGLGPPDRTPSEAAVEDLDGEPGKLIVSNLGRDEDFDGIPDFADGYDFDGTGGNNDDLNQKDGFAQAILEIPAPIDLDTAKVRISYTASASSAVTLTSGEYAAAAGHLRLWLKNGDQARDPSAANASTPGDFVEPGVYSAAQLGMTTSRMTTLFVEGIDPGTDKITVEIDPDGDGPADFMLSDTVRVSVVHVDLDINNNGSLSDPVDGVLRYLPGYEGDVAKLNTGSQFITAVYQAQEMQLIAEGVGVDAGVDSVVFRIVSTTDLGGYVENASDLKVIGLDREDDYSFDELVDSRSAPGTMESDRSYANFWAKDYGGQATVEVDFVRHGVTLLTTSLQVPKDGDGDGIADIWERKMVEQWDAQFDWTTPVDTVFFNDDDDKELIDPDGITDVLTFSSPSGQKMGNHAAAGDGRTVLQEYRGFILDGGGHDWAGANPHPGGHVRLSPAYKELLVEVDAMEAVTHMPDRAGIAGWMDTVAIGMSQAEDGAGIRMFYIIDDIATPHDNFALWVGTPDGELTDYAVPQVHPQLQSFQHLQLADEIYLSQLIRHAHPAYGAFYFVSTGVSAGTNDNVDLGIFHAYVISHELHHLTAATGGHFTDTNGNDISGEVDDQYRVLWDYEYDYPLKSLAAPITATDTVIPLNDTTNLASPGKVLVDGSEIISYTGISGNNLTGAVRGSTASAHLADVDVRPRYYSRDAQSNYVRLRNCAVHSCATKCHSHSLARFC